MAINGFANAAIELGLTNLVLVKPKRGISKPLLANGTYLNDIIAQATIEEKHDDELEITNHPIEQGAAIQDHAFLRSSRVTLRLGWSNSPSDNSALGALANIGVSTLGAAGGAVGAAAANVLGIAAAAQSLLSGSNVDQVTHIYNQLLVLYMNRAIFTLYTGKRPYYNMICKGLHTETNWETANTLPITMECQQLLLVNTSTVKLPTISQANPQQTGQLVSRGIQQAFLSQTSSLNL